MFWHDFEIILQGLPYYGIPSRACSGLPFRKIEVLGQMKAENAGLIKDSSVSWLAPTSSESPQHVLGAKPPK